VVRARETSTGDASFDERFLVVGAPDAAEQVLTPELRQLIMGRDDWAFWAER
jgi:hypothetical protein